MKSEEIMMVAFVGIVVIGIPLLLWYIDREKKREEREEREEWARKNREKLEKQRLEHEEWLLKNRERVRDI
jgi:di/tricarboxylate transporter